MIRETNFGFTKRSTRNLLFLFFLLMPPFGFAATIAVRNERIVCTREVTLGDVAVITPSPGETGEDIETLKKVVVCSPPLPGKDRVLNSTRIKDVLGLRGMPWKHFLTGASQVVITASGETGKDKDNVSAASSEEIARTVERGIVSYLKYLVSEEAPWKVTVSLPPDHRKLLDQCGTLLAVRGGTPPFTGRQTFDLQFSGTDPETGENITVRIGVEVSAPPMVVTAKRMMSRGTVIGPADVMLSYPQEKPNAENPLPQDAFTKLEDVVGREILLTVRQGTVLTASQIQMPVLVKRNEVVTVYSKMPGVTVKTVGRSRQEGRLHDLIVIEQLKERKTFTGRVIDVGVVEAIPQNTPVTDSGVNPSKIQPAGYDNSTFIKIPSPE
ncbi:MAG: flagellar basal body P-ring formation chaperone FlgA [Planctomycetaceae bacterium]|jgi:flagella basal body P-ring formation protein FlgA|nr:flagellar basal body P-ring formation chaperone FlgA [Planctomycetaceae bacterium]